MTRSARGLRALATAAAVAVSFTVADGATAASVITFSSFVDALPATPSSPVIAGRGAGRGGALPSAWGWNYSGNPADTQYAVYGSSTAFVNNIICIGTNGACASNSPAGGTYLGYEFLHFRFDLPVDATNVTLNMITQNGDDRHVLLVNGNSLGGFHSPLAGPTAQSMKDGSGLHEVTFKPVVANTTFSDPTLFLVGQPNYLSFWLNNTNTGVIGPAIAHLGAGDPSALYVAGWIGYDTTVVPLPPAGALMLAGAGLLGWHARRGRRCAG